MDSMQIPDPALVALGIRPDQHPPIRVRMARKKDPSEGRGVVDKGMFHLCHFRARGAGKDAVSDPHPSFSGFNSAAPDKRRILRGNLVHAVFPASERMGTVGACYTRFRADLLPGVRMGSVEGNRPCCTGDGVSARRWNVKAGEFEDIGCPGDLCEFRQTPPGAEFPPCKRSSSLVFQLRWPAATPYPCLTAMIETAGSWSFASHQWWGLYTTIKQQWDLIVGQGEPDVYGLPIRLQLVERATLGTARRPWVPELHLDFEEGKTLQDFLLFRARARREARTLIASDGGPLALPDYGAVEAADAVYEAIEVERPAP